MKFRDLPVDKKVLYTNFMMVAVPVLLVLAAMSCMLVIVVSRTGSFSPDSILSSIDKDVSNYQLQFMFDSLNEKTANSDVAVTSNDELTDICSNLEKMGFEISITGDSGTYLTGGNSMSKIQEDAALITGSLATNSDKPLFFRNANQTIYHNTVKTPEGGREDILLVNSNLAYQSNEYQMLKNTELFAKITLIAAGCAIILIIVLTGILLGKKLSRSILSPISKLNDATDKIKNGNLDEPVAYESKDEFGQVCGNFEAMRLRLKEAVITRQVYEDGRKQLIAGISHDLATPLTAIKGYTKGVLDGIADTPEKKDHYVRMTYDAACRMEKLVDNLLLFAKLDMRQEPFHLKPANLSVYLEAFCEEIRLRLSQEQMEITFLNKCPDTPVAKIDGTQFERVLLNLAENSIKYKRSGRAGKIILTLFRNETGDLALWFEDNGIGINAKDSGKVFQSFYRCEPNGGPPIQGSGLGLAISKQIIESMGGTIWAEGRPGSGFRITIALPKSNGDVK
jgi:Signal transduction histidine kinase